VDGQADVVDQGPALGTADGQGPHVEDDLVGDGRVAGLRRRQLAAHHELGELAGRRRAGGDRRDGGAGAQDGDRVGDPQHLVELVADEDDGHALGAQAGERGEQLVDLLRDEHGGRLVEDEHAGAAVEHLEDLDALAVADPQVLDERVRVDPEAVAAGQVEHAGRAVAVSSRPRRRGSAPSTTFSRTVRLSASMKCWCTMPMPAAIASPGSAKRTARPSTSIVPSSGRCMP
jgi:hypothetical protein